MPKKRKKPVLLLDFEVTGKVSIARLKGPVQTAVTALNEQLKAEGLKVSLDLLSISVEK